MSVKIIKTGGVLPRVNIPTGSYDFIRANNDELTVSKDTWFKLTNPLAPLTLACWFNPKDVTNGHCLMFVGDQDRGDRWMALYADGAASGDPIIAWARDNNEVGTSAVTSTGFVANKWQHAAAVFVSTTSRTPYLNGGGDAENTVDINPTVNVMEIPAITIGRLGDSTPGGTIDGSIALPAIWERALLKGETQDLAAGADPRDFPYKLVHLWQFDPRTDVRDIGQHANVKPTDLVVTGATWSNKGPTTGVLDLPSIGKAPAVGGAEEFLGRQYPQGVLRGVMRGAA